MYDVAHNLVAFLVWVSERCGPLCGSARVTGRPDLAFPVMNTFARNDKKTQHTH